MRNTELGPRGLVIDFALMVMAIIGASLGIWGIAKVFRSFHSQLLYMLVMVPPMLTVQLLLRRHCYAHTSCWKVFRAISPLDPVPAPLGRKIYVAFVGGALGALAMLLAYVILSRTWYAERIGAPQTSLVFDVLHPWEVAPLYQSDPAQDSTKARPVQVVWWLWVCLGLLLCPFTLALCGTLERNALLARQGPFGGQQAAPPELSGARIAAILSVLLFWLPLVGLVVGTLAYGLNRRSGDWRYRVTLVAFAATILVHAALVVMIVIASS